MTSMAGVVHSDSRVMDLIDSSVSRIYGLEIGHCIQPPDRMPRAPGSRYV
jgi:hypothetical protein